MGNQTGIVAQQRKTVGDLAVDGLLMGMAASLAMGGALLLLELLDRVGPVELLGRFDPANGGSAVAGGLMFLAVAGLYGVVYAVVYRLSPGSGMIWTRFGWLIGAAYGLCLWLLAQYVFLPGLHSALETIPSSHFAAAHLVYGLTLGYLWGRSLSAAR
ncbi:MAG: hypothetical protein KA586_11430 [Candidatus Promineofilum sp.]|nr:hypothetical protein [Promineifilum sp.]